MNDPLSACQSARIVWYRTSDSYTHDGDRLMKYKPRIAKYDGCAADAVHDVVEDLVGDELEDMVPDIPAKQNETDEKLCAQTVRYEVPAYLSTVI